jgi:hypothetical protein
MNKFKSLIRLFLQIHIALCEGVDLIFFDNVEVCGFDPHVIDEITESRFKFEGLFKHD